MAENVQDNILVGTVSGVNNMQKKPLVFISHDTRDAELAEQFSKLLGSVSAGVLKSFRSSDKKGVQGMEYGVEWYPEIMKKLDEATDVVCLLTRNSLERPWLLFEAGVAKGKLNTTVLGISIGIPLKDAISGPFAQFQNCGDDEESLSKLVMQLAKTIPNAEPDMDVIKAQVSIFLKNAQQLLAQNNVQAEQNESGNVQEASVAKLFEEIKVMYSELPEKMRAITIYEERPMRKRKFHPKMMKEIFYGSKNKKWGWMIALGLLRDDFPWIYEAGYNLIRMAETATKEQMQKQIDDFRDMLDFTFRGPFGMEMLDRESESRYIGKEFMMLMDSFEVELFDFLYRNGKVSD